MALSKDVVIRLLGESDSATKAIKSAADAAEVSVGAYRRAEREQAKHRQAMQQAGQTATVMGSAMLLGFGVAVKAAADFDKAMSGVSAATNASAGDLERLRAAALEAGASTAYSATEAAQAQMELAKAGVSVADILGGGLAGALDLAAAGQLAVADAAGIAATAMQQFGLSGKDLPHVADLLAAGAGKAMGSVDDLGQALNQAGLVASATGLGIEETTGALSAFAANGLIGSDAGTSLKTMLQKLQNPSKEAAKEMERLGINMYDANGAFAGMDVLAGQMKTNMAGLTQAERDKAMATIFGSDAVRAANVLYKEGSAGIEDWTNKVNDAGYAQEQAAKLTDNLAGDMERLGGAMSTALIKGGSGANEVLRWLTQAATGAVDAFADLPEPLQGAGVGLLGVVGGGTAVLGIVGTMIPKIHEAREALRGLGDAGKLADRGLGVVGRVAGYTAVAAAGLGLLHTAVGALGGNIEIVTRDTDVLINELTELGTATSRTAAAAADFDLGLLAQQLGMVRPDIAAMGRELGYLDVDFGLVSRWVGIDDPVLASFEQATVAIEETDGALAGMIGGGRPEAAVAAFDRIAEAAAAQGVPLNDLREKFPSYVAALETYVGQSTYTVDASGNVTNALGEQADAADILKQSWDALNGIAVDVVTAEAEWTLALDKLREGTDGASRSLDIHTVAGATNSQQMVGLAQDAQNLAAAIGNRDGYDAGIAAAAQFRQSLIDQAVAAGYDRGEVERLIGQIFNLDNTNSTSDLIANDQVSPAVDHARRQLAALDGTGATVTITTVNRILNARPINEVGSGGNPIGLPPVPRRAGGGPVWPGTFLVGEKGPELVQFGASGFVTPADLTTKVLGALRQPTPSAPALALAAAGSGRGGSTTYDNRSYRTVQVEVTNTRPMSEKQLLDSIHDQEFLHG